MAEMLKKKLKEKIEAFRPRTTKLNKEFGDVLIDKVTIGQAIGGARDVRCLVTDISYLDPQEGIRFRGKTIPETFAALPKVPGKEQPFVEGFFYFLLTGEVPTMAQTLEIVEEWKTRAAVPQYVWDVLRAMPRDTHPMTMLSTAVLSMQRDSIFAKRYGEGLALLQSVLDTGGNDLVVVAPASADILAKMAAGLADDLASTLLLATDKPVLVAPAMNVSPRYFIRKMYVAIWGSFASMFIVSSYIGSQ